MEGKKMTRSDGRKVNQLRKIKITKNISKYAEGSCLIECGDTRVMCTATIEENVPPFLRNSGTGWITAEYGMLPRSCQTRIAREKTSGRIHEIQRLVGRSLRSVVDMENLGERTIKIDCDVLQADGGTRTASITGGFVAMAQALTKLRDKDILNNLPLIDYVAAVSVGMVDGMALLDLNYAEDSKADIDMNVVMLGKGEFVEIQGTGEKKTFSKKQMDALVTLAQDGVEELFKIQKSVLDNLKIKTDRN